MKFISCGDAYNDGLYFIKVKVPGYKPSGIEPRRWFGDVLFSCWMSREQVATVVKDVNVQQVERGDRARRLIN